MKVKAASGPESQPDSRSSRRSERSVPIGTSCALLTRMSTPPKAWTVAPTQARISASRFTSQAVARAVPPRRAISAAVRSTLERVRPVTITRAPSAASAYAIPSPTPCPRPVSSSRLPSRCPFSRPPPPSARPPLDEADHRELPRRARLIVDVERAIQNELRPRAAPVLALEHPCLRPEGGALHPDQCLGVRRPVAQVQVPRRVVGPTRVGRDHDAVTAGVDPVGQGRLLLLSGAPPDGAEDQVVHAGHAPRLVGVRRLHGRDVLARADGDLGAARLDEGLALLGARHRPDRTAARAAAPGTPAQHTKVRTGPLQSQRARIHPGDRSPAEEAPDARSRHGSMARARDRAGYARPRLVLRGSPSGIQPGRSIHRLRRLGPPVFRRRQERHPQPGGARLLGVRDVRARGPGGDALALAARAERLLGAPPLPAARDRLHPPLVPPAARELGPRLPAARGIAPRDQPP